jgi:uncharacterized protein YeaC (DUF1315 family)
MKLTFERAKELVSYDPSDGRIIWRHNYHEVGCKSKRGYRYVYIGGVSCLAHRVAWLLHTGRWPDGPLDHINGIKDDNRFCNLRCVTLSENQHNQRKAHTKSKTGLLGVFWSGERQRYFSRISVDGKRIHLGYFNDQQQARRAYVIAKQKYHPSAP